MTRRDRRCDHEPVDLSGEYRLLQQRPGPHYAAVRVTAASSPRRAPVVAADAFDWLAEVYGAGYGVGPATEEYRVEATSGATYALGVAASSATVSIREIRYSPADTGPGDVRFATAWAVWNALGYEPEHPPWVDDEGVHFPEPGDGG